MPFNIARFEKYAMQAETISQNAQPLQDGIDVDAVGAALGFDRDASRELAVQLAEEEWAKVSFAQNTPRLKLTLKGYKEIAKLRRPGWQRWIDNNPKTFTVLTGIFTVVTTSLIIELLKRLFWK